MSNNIFFERGQMADKPNNYLWNGDCLELMKDIPDKSIDAIICDLPYGTTQNKWDSIIPFSLLWEQYDRIAKENTPFVLFGAEPFSSALRMSNINNYKYDWVWDKVQTTGSLNAKKQPLRQYELISVFYKKQCTYNRQFTDRPIKNQRPNRKNHKTKEYKTTYGKFTRGIGADDYDNTKINPKNILTFNNGNAWSRKGNHTSQKPLELIKYLVKTYTNENDWVLDNTCGSNTTGVACYDLNRNYIGIEKDKNIYEVAKKRMEKNILLRANKPKTLFEQ